MSPLFAIFVFFIVIVITAVVFFGWVTVAIFSVVLRGLGSLFAPGGGGTRVGGRQMGGTALPHTVRCQTRGCFAINPMSARFCRRCGRGLPAAQQVQVRRAAVW